jgi:hypothetical protein
VNALAKPIEAAVGRLLDEAMTELGHEEAKAGRVMTTLAVTTGVLVAGFFAGGWRPTSLAPAGTALWTFGGIVLVLALMFVGVAVMVEPRRADRKQTFQSLLDEIEQRDGDLAGRLWSVRTAVATKRRLLTIGLTLAGSGFGLCVAVGLTAT